MLNDLDKTAGIANATRDIIDSGYDPIGFEAGVLAMAERVLDVDDEESGRHDQVIVTPLRLSSRSSSNAWRGHRVC